MPETTIINGCEYRIEYRDGIAVAVDRARCASPVFYRLPDEPDPDRWESTPFQTADVRGERAADHVVDWLENCAG